MLLCASSILLMRKDVYSMKATIERDGCIGCGLCAETCPAVFYIADDGLADIKQDPTPETLEACADAEQGCPVNVIQVSAQA